MRIAAYIRPENLKNPTGVGKHQINIVKELSQLSDLVLLVPINPDMDSVKREYGNIPIRMIPFPRKIIEFLMIRTNLPLLDKYLPEGTDWLHFPFEMSVKSRRAKTAVTFHSAHWFENNLSWSGRKETVVTKKAMTKAFTKSLARADKVLVVSEYLKKRISDIFSADLAKINVIGNGVENIYYDLETMPHDDNKPPMILIIAPLIDIKGARYVISAARKMKSVMPSARFVIANGACGTEEYVAEAKSVGNIELLGYTPGFEVVKLMAKAKALLILSEYESFGMPAIEAMAAGIPVVSADYAALPEVIGDAGIVVKADDASSVCKALSDIITNDKLNNALRAKGIARAKEFSWRKCAERLLGALESGANRRM